MCQVVIATLYIDARYDWNGLDQGMTHLLFDGYVLVLVDREEISDVPQLISAMFYVPHFIIKVSAEVGGRRVGEEEKKHVHKHA